MEIDLDINSYSFNDLKQLLNIKNNDINESELENNYINKKKELEKINDQDNYENINQFIDNVYKFLKLHIKESNIENNIEKTYEIKKIDNKLDYLINFNFENTKKLENIYSVNPINQSNIPLNPRTYNTIKKQVAINSNFRKKSQISLEDRLLLEKLQRSCGGYAIPTIVENINKQNNKESSTNFTIELSEPIDNVIGLELVSTEIPMIFYTFSTYKRNSTFKITFYDDTVPVAKEEYIITIPDGMWSSNKLEEFLNENYFDNNIIVKNKLKNKYLRYLTFIIVETSGRVVIRFKTTSEITEYNNNIQTTPRDDLDPDITNFSYSLENVYDTIDCNNKVNFVQGFRENNSAIDEEDFKYTTLGTLGYLEGQIYNIGNTIINKSKLIPLIIKFSDPFYLYTIGFTTYNGYLLAGNIYGGDLESAIYIRVNDFVGNRGEQIILTGRDKTQITNNVLSRVAFKTSIFQNNIFNSLQDYNIKRNYFGGVRITKLQIQIIDKYGRIINLQNHPTNFVFEFTIEYSSERLANFRNEMFNSNN